jgi:hypothetical protein
MHITFKSGSQLDPLKYKQLLFIRIQQKGANFSKKKQATTSIVSLFKIEIFPKEVTMILSF